MGQDDKNKKYIFVNNLLIVVSEWKLDIEIPTH
jgi:hypothetical protein